MRSILVFRWHMRQEDKVFILFLLECVSIMLSREICLSIYACMYVYAVVPYRVFAYDIRMPWCFTSVVVIT